MKLSVCVRNNIAVILPLICISCISFVDLRRCRILVKSKLSSL